MRIKLFVGGFLAVSGNELLDRSMPLCEEHEAWFGQKFGTITDGEGAYDDTFKCRWSVDGATATGAKNLCIRFSRFDIEDSKTCTKTVVELSYGNVEPQSFCQTLGADRDRHKMMRNVMQRAFRPGNPRKARSGENFLTWTCLDTHRLTIQMASHPGANGAGNYQGFEMLWATESTTSFTDLQSDIDEFGSQLSFYDDKRNRRTRKHFGKLMTKLNRTLQQGRVTCTAVMDNAPEFLLDEWNATKTTNTIAALTSFLQSYTEVLHVGCYKRYNKVTDKVLSRFTNRLK